MVVSDFMITSDLEAPSKVTSLERSTAKEMGNQPVHLAERIWGIGITEPVPFWLSHHGSRASQKKNDKEMKVNS